MVNAVRDSDILAEVILPSEGSLAPDVARSLLQWRFSDRAIERMNVLAERNGEGVITEDEREELHGYLRVGALINLIQAKAKLSLSRAASTDT